MTHSHPHRMPHPNFYSLPNLHGGSLPFFLLLAAILWALPLMKLSNVFFPSAQISDADLVVKVTTKKLLSVHDIGTVQIPLLQHVKVDMGLEMATLTEVLTKQGSRNNPNNRGTLNFQVGMRPLTYIMDGPSLFSMLPHEISMWVIAVVKPDDTKTSPVRNPSLPFS